MKTKHYADWLRNIHNVRQYDFGPLKTYINEENRLHRDNGPAYISPTTLISYQNGRRHGLSADIWGSQVYYYNGVLIPKKYMTDPDSLTFEEVISHNNSEVRSVGIRIYGFDRMLREERFDILEIEKQTNYMLLKWSPKDPDEAFCLVRVFNGTANEDGSRDIYYLVVPPTMTTVRQAVSWTFYKEEDDYNPTQET